MIWQRRALDFVPTSLRASVFRFCVCSVLLAHERTPASTMTARAFLGLSGELREAFAKAQDDETLRYLRVKIVNEDTLTVAGSKQKGADISTDFDGLGQVRVASAGDSISLQFSRSARD